MLRRQLHATCNWKRRRHVSSFTLLHRFYRCPVCCQGKVLFVAILLLPSEDTSGGRSHFNLYTSEDIYPQSQHHAHLSFASYWKLSVGLGSGKAFLGQGSITIMKTNDGKSHCGYGRSLMGWETWLNPTHGTWRMTLESTKSLGARTHSVPVKRD